jgi:transposase
LRPAAGLADSADMPKPAPAEPSPLSAAAPQGVLRPALELRARGLARRFFDNWRAWLKWQRLKPYKKFANMIERHWDGIAAYCKPENKVSLGFVEGLNNKIRVIQRRAYGLRDEEYLRLKILTCMLPML